MSLFERVDTKEFFIKVLLMVALLHFVDIVSTQVMIGFYGGSEGNEFLANPITGHLLLNRAIATKIFTSIVFAGGSGAILYYLTKSWFFASLGLIWEGYMTFMGPVVNNVAQFMREILSHIRS